MTLSRVALIAGVVFLSALVILFALAVHPILVPFLILVALVLLIGGGNVLYGQNSPGAKAQARVRPAQEAHNRAIDEARRRAAADPTDLADPPVDPPAPQ
jgi:hypothetical protein